MKKITVVLSGVGISGYTGIALLEFFDKHQIKPNLLVGCSSGALIAALWAKGFSPEESLEIVKSVFQKTIKPKIDFFTSLFFFQSPGGKFNKDHALLKADHLQKLYHDIFKKQHIEHLPVQTLFQTTNVDIGETYFIKEGLVADAVYAASAILPFYPAINIHGLWLADGVFSETLPLKAVLDEKSELIIATDVSIRKEKKVNDFMSYYSQFLQNALKISSASRTALVYNLHHDEILIIPIRINFANKENSLDALHHGLQSARESIAKKEDVLLEAINASK